MKFFRGLLVVALIAAAGVWYFDQYEAEQAEKLARAEQARAEREDVQTLYRWVDADGVTQVTREPPNDREYRKIEFDPKQNVMPANPDPQIEPADSGD